MEGHLDFLMVQAVSRFSKTGGRERFAARDYYRFWQALSPQHVGGVLFKAKQQRLRGVPLFGVKAPKTAPGPFFRAGEAQKAFETAGAMLGWWVRFNGFRFLRLAPCVVL